jgi:hypothetical protein
MSPQYLKRFALGALLGAFGLQAATTIPAEFAYPLSAASAANRAAALKAQQDALKKLADAAATGDAKAKEAIDKYRASK